MAKEINVYLVEIIYKSGAKVRFWFKTFDFELYNNNVTNLEWETVSPLVQPMLMGVDHISSMHQIDARNIKDLKDPLDTRMKWEK